MPAADSDDLQLVSVAITTEALCVTCIMQRVGVTRVRTLEAITALATAVRITRTRTLCDSCFIFSEVFRLA